MRILILLLLFQCLTTAQGASFDYQAIAPHPRLLLRAGEENMIRKNLKGNADMTRIHNQILSEADSFLGEAPVERIKEGKRLLAISRIALKRIFYLSYAYRMTQEEKYSRRAEEEMLAVSAFSDWNPSHFLDVGEMTMALALGYDWLYNQLSSSTKTLVRQAIIEKGFAPSSNPKQAWFYRSATNWNQVCNGGLVYGALAIYEDAPEMARHIINRCMETNPLSLQSYAPDGGYPEGYGYWGYGTSFQVLLIAALESALGNDGSLSSYPGFLESAEFMQMMCGPSGLCFNFSDAEPLAECHLMLFWFARKTGNASILWPEINKIRQGVKFAEDRFLPCLLIFGSQYRLEDIPTPKRHIWYSRGKTPVYIYRSDWQSNTDTYLGIKGGSASTSHAHMDAGSFVFESEGIRWAMDLGIQEYYTLESQGVDLWNSKQEGQRWEVYRIGPIPHNTLTVNGHRHTVEGSAPILDTLDAQDKKGAIVDLSQILNKDLQSAVRTITIDSQKCLTISDQLTAGDSTATIRWSMSTPADAVIADERTIVLEKEGKKRLLRVQCENQKPTMKIWTNVPLHSYDLPNPGSCRVGFEVTLSPGEKVFLKTRLTLADH